MSRAFTPVRIGSWDLPQAFVMAPLTRNRAGAGNAPTELNATYYAQRAGAGLIVTEGTAPSAVGQGYLNVPGLYTPEQVAGWRLVADEVHAAGGRIVAQLMHAGRIAHRDNKDGVETISASAVTAPGEMVTADGPKPHDEPRALESEELAGVVADYVAASRNAVEAGLDGVEIHAANGYLLHQFLDPTINLREDGHGGSPANRARFVVEVVTAVAEAIGADRVGLRISPGHQFNGVGEQPGDDLGATYAALVDGVAPLGLAYLSVLASPLTGPIENLVGDLRQRFGGSVLLNDGFGDVTTLETVEQLLETGLADAVVVGRPFLANPDLDARWEQGAELNEPDAATFYGGGAEGYTDYPTLDQAS
jgi:2,4-dienoyl-CoA reductase-like NADH-dependent reductase (Old Yellow Enzyme family)